MARRFSGIRALGRMTPEMRSAFQNISRAVRGTSQSQRGAPLPNEAEIARSPGVAFTAGHSAGGRGTVTTFGVDADKPTTTFLAKRGVGAFVYIATDTNKVYIWNGGAYKSSTFS